MLDTQLNKEVPVLEAQQAKGRSSTSYDSETNGPQYPARPCARSTAAERSGQGRGAAKNLRTMSRETDLATIIAEKVNIRCDILGLCETWCREPLHVRWEDGSTVALGTGEGDRTVGGVGFIVSKRWAPFIDEVDLTNSRVGVLTLLLPNKTRVGLHDADGGLVGQQQCEHTDSGVGQVDLVDERRPSLGDDETDAADSPVSLAGT
ncbi:UNVERIFIED_CONTAM: hypothetical protein FKN15_021729 [Acipenser sinensis]